MIWQWALSIAAVAFFLAFWLVNASVYFSVWRTIGGVFALIFVIAVLVGAISFIWGV